MEAAEAVTSRMVARELYAKGVANRITRQLSELELSLGSDLAAALVRLSRKDETRLLQGNYTTQRLKKMIAQVQQFSVDWANIVKTQLESGAIDLIEAEIEFERSFLANYATEAGLTVDIGATISPRQVFTAARRRPMETKIMREVFPDMSRNVKKRVVESLRTSYQSGESINQATARIRRGLDINRRGAEGLARTGLAHYSFNTTLDSLTAMGVDKIQWISTLDSRTTTICQSLDQRIFDISDSRMPRVPRHFRCRSTIVPYLGEDMGGQRASRGAEGFKHVDASLNYEKWLRRQPAGYAREILGTTQYRIWKTGIPVTKFTDKYATRAFTAAELKERYAMLFRKSSAEVA